MHCTNTNCPNRLLDQLCLNPMDVWLRRDNAKSFDHRRRQRPLSVKCHHSCRISIVARSRRSPQSGPSQPMSHHRADLDRSACPAPPSGCAVCCSVRCPLVPGSGGPDRCLESCPQHVVSVAAYCNAVAPPLSMLLVSQRPSTDGGLQ